MCIQERQGSDRSWAVGSVHDRGTSGRLSGLNQATLDLGPMITRHSVVSFLFFFFSIYSYTGGNIKIRKLQLFIWLLEKASKALSAPLHLKQWHMLIELNHFQLRVFIVFILFKINASQRPDATISTSVITLLLFISNIQWAFPVSDSTKRLYLQEILY